MPRKTTCSTAFANLDDFNTLFVSLEKWRNAGKCLPEAAAWQKSVSRRG